MNRQELEQQILGKLAPTLAETIRRELPLHKGEVEEIRLRTGRPLTMTISGKNTAASCICGEEDMQETIRRLCDRSLYSHAETIRDGYICVGNGIRAGVCGRAVLENGRIALLKEIRSVCIRLPRRVPHAADDLYRALAEGGFRDSVLVYSPPGGGKTTVLRELAAKLADPPEPKRVALVDTRYELGAGLESVMMLDVLSGYPRHTGMEIAMRTLAPEYILCDEVASPEDRQALLSCIGSGIRLCASVHCGSLAELRRHPLLQAAPGAFRWLYGIDGAHNGTLTDGEDI